MAQTTTGLWVFWYKGVTRGTPPCRIDSADRSRVGFRIKDVTRGTGARWHFCDIALHA
jgi:hypothetical protein